MADEKNNAGGDAAKRGGVGAASVAVAAVLFAALAVLLVFPGFLAAGLSKLNRKKVAFCVNGNLAWRKPGYYNSELPAKYPAESLALAPSGLLMERWPAMRRFYLWQYHAAGGAEIWIEMD